MIKIEDGAMSDLDFQKDPLNLKNLNSLNLEEASRKIEAPSFNQNDDCFNTKKNNNSLSFIVYLFLVFFALMGLTWIFRFIEKLFFL